MSRICCSSAASIFAIRRSGCDEQVRTNVCCRHSSPAGEWHAWLSAVEVHLDEMYVKLNGEMVYLWRAVDHEGQMLESFVTIYPPTQQMPELNT